MGGIHISSTPPPPRPPIPYNKRPLPPKLSRVQVRQKIKEPRTIWNEPETNDSPLIDETDRKPIDWVSIVKIAVSVIGSVYFIYKLISF